MKTLYRCRFFEFCNRYQQGYECRYTTSKAAAFDISDEKRRFIVDGDLKIEIDPDENKRGGQKDEHRRGLQNIPKYRR